MNGKRPYPGSRPSGTEPVIRVMVEGPEIELIERIAEDMEQTIVERLGYNEGLQRIGNNLERKLILPAEKSWRRRGGPEDSRPVRTRRSSWNTPKGDVWRKTNARHLRSSSGGGKWEIKSMPRDHWTIEYKQLRFKISPTGFKQIPDCFRSRQSTVDSSWRIRS